MSHPICPKCGEPMIVIDDSKTGKEIWVCPNRGHLGCDYQEDYIDAENIVSRERD